MNRLDSTARERSVAPVRLRSLALGVVWIACTWGDPTAIRAQQQVAPDPQGKAVTAQERSAPVSNDPVLEERTRLVASQLRCPVCQGNSIQDSPSELAQEMKGVVRDQLASGKTPEEVTQYFVAKYGEWILLEPKASGFNLVAYLLPVVAVLIGGAVIWRSVRRWTAASDAGDELPVE